MATKPYRLTLLLRMAGSNAGTTQRAVTIAAEAADEAVELAEIYRAGLPSAALISAMLTDTAGTVLWSEQESSAPDVALRREDQS